MSTLLEIGSNVRALADLIDEVPDGELTPCAEAALEAWFAELQDAKEEKLDGFCAYIRTLMLRAAARREEMERLEKLVEAEENKVKRLKERLMLFMSMTGEKRIETARYRITLCANGGRQPLKIGDPVTLPGEYQRLTVEADVDTIRAALEAGQDVPGCSLQARGAHVRIG